MRHAIGTPRYVSVASWLTVAAVGLAIGAVVAGGLVAAGTGPGDQGGPVSALAPAGPVGANSANSANSPKSATGGTAAGEKALRPGRVVSPSTVPDGSALPGGAPSARVAGPGEFTGFRPESLLLPSGRRAEVEPARVHADGALDIPADPARVGWWTGGAQAGEPFGSVVLAGHVDSAAYGLGALAELLHVRLGERITLGSGRHRETYQVTTVREVPKARLAAGTDLFDQGVGHRLVLITCGGPFDRRTHGYRDNVVVIATPVA